MSVSLLLRSPRPKEGLISATCDLERSAAHDVSPHLTLKSVQKSLLLHLPELKSADFGIRVNRRIYTDEDDQIELLADPHEPYVVEIYGRLRGGKGGFGTLLRGKGSRGPKTNNFESSRNLEGRRLRVARAPERMRQWRLRKAQENAIIQAVGGEDRFIGKKLSSRDVVKVYQLAISADSHDPFEVVEEDDGQQTLRSEAVSCAVDALAGRSCVARTSVSVEKEEKHFSAQQEDLLDSYLQVDDI